MYSRCFQEVRVQESSATCNIENKGLLRMRQLHLEFCDGKSWVRLLDQKVALNSREKAGQYRKPLSEVRIHVWHPPYSLRPQCSRFQQFPT